MIILSKVKIFVSTLILCRLGAIYGSILTYDIDKNGDLNAENILVKFMADLRKFTIDKCDYQDVIVSSNYRWHVQTTVRLTDGIPRLIGTPTDVTIPKSLCVAILFVDSVDNLELESIFAKLSPISKNSLWLISMSQNTVSGLVAIRLRLALNMKLRNVKYVALSGRYGISKIYMKIYSENCTFEIKLVSSWTPGKGFTVNPDDLDSHLISPTIGRGCPGHVSVPIAPELLGGLESHLIQTIANDLNFVPVIKISSNKKEFSIPSNGTPFGVIEEVSREVAQFGIGQLRATLARAEIVDFTVAYQSDRLVWTVPVVVANTIDIVHAEFSSFTWLMVLLPLFLYSIITCLVSKFNTGKYRLITNICDVISMTLNYAVIHQPAGITGTLTFLLYVMYARIISTAYSTSLASILTTALPRPLIVDEMRIITSDLRVAGSTSIYDMILELIGRNNTQMNSEMIKRFEVITSTDEALERINFGEKLAYLHTVSDMDRASAKFITKNKPLLFTRVPSTLNSYSSSIAFPKGSTVVERINRLVLRLSQSGILQFWDDEDSAFAHLSKEEILEIHHNSLVRVLASIFNLYWYCLIPTVLVFIGELTVFNLQIDRRLHFWIVRNRS